jgi:hypothetical protein
MQKAMPDSSFQPNEPVLYPVTDQYHNRVVHRVTFLKDNGDGTGDVIMTRGVGGQVNLQRVPLTALQKEPPAAIRPEYRIQSPPPPPPRVSTESRRATLRRAHDAAPITAKAVSGAKANVSAIVARLRDAEQERERITRIEAKQASMIVASVRDGQPFDDVAEYDLEAKNKAIVQVSQNEAAAKVLRRELVEVEAQHRKSLTEIQTAASHVVGAIIESATDELKTTMRLRSALRASLQLWPGSTQAAVPVNSAVSNYLMIDPSYSIINVVGMSGRDAAAAHRMKPFADFHSRLVVDPEAQFSWN